MSNSVVPSRDSLPSAPYPKAPEEDLPLPWASAGLAIGGWALWFALILTSWIDPRIMALAMTSWFIVSSLLVVAQLVSLRSRRVRP